MANASHRTKILAKLAARATARKNNTQEPAESSRTDPPVLRQLQTLFSTDARKMLAKCTNPKPQDQIAERADLRTLAETFLFDGARLVDKAPPPLLNKLGRQVYVKKTNDSTEEEDRTMLSIFNAVSENTTKDYARRLASFLGFLFSILEDENKREECSLRPKASCIEAVQTFREAFDANQEDKNSLIALLLSISAQTYDLLDHYNADLFCSFAIGQLYEANEGKFRSKENANKTLSAFKYSLRMAVLFKVTEDSSMEHVLISRLRFKRDAPSMPFKQLTILQAGVNALGTKLNPVAMVVDTQCERISYSGIACSFDLLNDVVHSTIEEAQEKLTKMLMGFLPEDVDLEGSFGYSSAPFVPRFAFGQVPDEEYGDMSLFDYVIGHAKWKKHFFGLRRQNVKRTEGRAFLKACRDYERLLLVLFHVLVGCGSRATEYGDLSFMNGNLECEARTVSIYDETYLHCTMPNRKVSQLRRKSNAYSVFLPRKIADALFIPYWKYVRPFALMVMDSLRITKSFERWQRYCFVQAGDAKWVRETICQAFGGKESCRTFQWLRHASNFLWKMFTKASAPASALPVFKLFGHSQSTDACYAVEKLSGYDLESSTNTTERRIMLEIFWSKINLDDRRENPTDVVHREDDSGDESDSEDDMTSDAESDAESDANSPKSNPDLVDSAAPTSPDSEDQDLQNEDMEIQEDQTDEANNSSNLVNTTIVGTTSSATAATVQNDFGDAVATACSPSLPNETRGNEIGEDLADDTLGAGSQGVYNDSYAVAGESKGLGLRHTESESPHEAVEEGSALGMNSAGGDYFEHMTEGDMESSTEQHSAPMPTSSISIAATSDSTSIITSTRGFEFGSSSDSCNWDDTGSGSSTTVGLADDNVEAPIRVEDVQRGNRNSATLDVSTASSIPAKSRQEQLKDTLRKLGMSGFKSNGQAQLVEEVVFGQSSMLGVLPTGGGKSLAMFSCLHSIEQKLTIAIFPLIAVRSDIKGRLDKMAEKKLVRQHRYREWQASISATPDELLRSGTRLILVSAEQAQKKQFHFFMRQAKERVAAVIFDEAPVFLSSPFRKNLALIPLLIRSMTPAKFVLLSATVPVDSEKRLLEAFGVPNATTIRMNTVNENIIHTVERSSKRTIAALDLVRYLLDPRECAVIFVKSVRMCEKVAEELNSIKELHSRVAYYHANLDSKEKARAHSQWKDRSMRIMVATTAFAFGVDSQSCSLVIHLEGAFDLETYCQGAGRAGRNGQRARSILLLSRGENRCDDNRLLTYIRTKSKCRRVLLSEALDSPALVSRSTCGECDNCRGLGSSKQQFEARLRREVENVESESSVQEDRAAASKRIALAKRSGSTLKKCLDLCVNRGRCLVCILLGSSTASCSHSLQECPYFRTRCFRCGDKHRRRDCKVEKLWKGACSSNAVCVTCCTPCDSMITSFHPGELTVGARCKYRDTIMPACMMLFRSRYEEVLEVMQSSHDWWTPVGRSVSICQYARWLCSVDSGLTNAAWLISHFLREQS